MNNKQSKTTPKQYNHDQNAAHSQVKLKDQANLTQQQLKDQKKEINDNVKHEYKEENTSFCGFFGDFLGLYRYGSTQEKTLMVLGIVLALMSGVAYPLHIYFWGKEIDHFIFDNVGLKNTLDRSLHYFLAFIGISLGSLLLNGFSFSIWRLISQTIARKIRQKYLYAFSKRKMGWIEQVNLYELFSSFKDDVFAIQKAIGDKIALLFNLIGLIISGCVAAAIIRWTFFLYVFALLPIGMGVLGYFIYVIVMKRIDSKRFYQKAQSRSIQAISLIKTVKSMGAEKFQETLYQDSLNQYKDKISVYPIKLAVSTGLFYFIQYFMFGISFLIGIQCIRGTSACPVSVTGSHYSVGQVHTVFFQIFMCAYNFLQLISNYEAVKDAIRGSKKIYSFIEQAQKDQNIENAQKMKDIKLPETIGEISMEKVSFAYPTNPKHKVLRDISITPLRNKFNAIVGITGSGKSTVTQLIMKFYQPSSGTIEIGGVDIRDIDEEWLRDRIGIVGQEPILFDGTIRDNVRIGKKDANDEQIWEVLKKTNLSEFVRRLPNQLDYNLGLGGSKLSGGQKQRLAIARALIKKPQLLILDEATSALDRKSEKMIQKTLESIFLSPDLSMTVICIAHKIRTIQKADKIWYLQNGYVKQQGKINELKCFQGIQLPPEDQQIQFDQQLTVPIKSQDKKNQIVTQQQQQADYDKNIYLKLLDYTQQKGSYVLGLFLSVICGLCHPFALLILCQIYYDQAITSYWGTQTSWCQYSMANGGNCQQMIQDNHNNSLKFVGALLGLAVFSFFPYFLQIFFMSKIEDEVGLKLSMQVYKKIIRMPVEWYQTSQNEGGQAASSYGLDAKQMSTLITTYIPVIICNFSTIISGIIICLVCFWKQGLISLVCLPLIAFGSYIGMIFISGYEDESLHIYDSSNKTAMQLMINIKTALSFNHHHNLLNKYHEMLKQPSSNILLRGLKIGLFYGLSSMTVLGTIGIILYSTAHLMASDSLQFDANIMSSYAVQIWAGWVAGNSFFFASKSAAGKKSAKRVFKLLESKSESEYQSQKSKQSIKVPINEIKGNISLKNVSFKYNNTDQYIIKNVSLTIQAGQKVAFVGQSGCGKSTLMLLIQRFYDYEGEITLDGINILNYDLQTYRSYFAVLNQQPNLFSGNLKDNIIANSGASTAQLQQACKDAFAYDMNRAWKGDISLHDNIKLFLEREVGPKGSKVSGGEKQRIACARAILRKPKIFLMDQGTSALDLQTQKRMQKNIDERFLGVTAINIAHRLQAIENSDVIYLFQGGHIVESGRYKQMLDRKGSFYRFVQGSRFKSINQEAQIMLNELVQKLLGTNK